MSRGVTEDSHIAGGARALLVGAAALALAFLGASPAAAGIADPDQDFGTNGLATVPFGAYAGANQLAIAPDGDIVVVGYAQTPAHQSAVAVARLNADGSLDQDFADDGRLTLDVGAGNDVATGVAVRPDGRIMVAGAAHLSGTMDSEVVVLQLGEDGSLDEAFADDGIATFGFGDAKTGSAAALALDADGSAVVVGRGQSERAGGADDVAIARLTSDGELDPSFADNGKLTIGLQDDGVGGTSHDAGSAVEIEADGQIAFSGSSSLDSQDVGLLGEVSPGGELEALQSFGGDPNYAARDITVLANGQPLAVGFSSAPRSSCEGEPGAGIYGSAMAWSVADGGSAQDWSYQPTFDDGPGRADATAVAALGDGRAVVSAEVQEICGSDEFDLLLFDPDSEAGFVSRDEMDIAASDLAVDADGTVLAAGTSGAETRGFTVARFLAPTVDPPSLPETKIVSGPRGKVAEAKLTFRFRSRSNDASFECKVDGRRWRRCESPYKLGPLPGGRHRFKVRAVSPDGELDPTPAKRRFAIR